jgi:FAD synthase
MKIRSSATDKSDGRPAVAVVGTWDPLLGSHRKLFVRLARRGKKAGLTPLVIILFPSPVRLLNPEPDNCLEYSDLAARAALIRESAGVKVLTVHMTVSDLGASTDSFFSLVCAHTPLRELWLGKYQSLGRCKQTSDDALAKLARRRKISLRRLPAHGERDIAQKAWRLIEQGELMRAVRCVGSPPTYRRPRSGVLRTSWPSGRYLAIPARESMFPSDSPAEAHPISLRVTNAERRRYMKWPERDIQWLTFIAGPADVKNPQ